MQHHRSRGLRGAAALAASAAMSVSVLADHGLHNISFEWGQPEAGWPQAAETWSGDGAVHLGPAGPIDPVRGQQMLRFDYASGTEATSSTLAQVVQLVDLSDAAGMIGDGRGRLHVSGWFNRVAGNAQTDTKFQVRVRAYAGTVSTFPAQLAAGSHLALVNVPLFSDDDPATWEEIVATLELPANTDFVAVELGAKEDVFNDTHGTEFDGHYADDVELTLLHESWLDVNGDNVVDLADAALVAFAEWGPCGGCAEDLDGDGDVDIHDLRIILAFADDGSCGDDDDGDGVPDCLDACPADPDKVQPGFCGCGVEETDGCGQGAGGGVGDWTNVPAEYGLESGLDLVFELAPGGPAVDDIIFQVWSSVSQSVEVPHIADTAPYVYPGSVLVGATPGPGQVQAIVRGLNGDVLDIVSASLTFVEGDEPRRDCPADLNRDGLVGTEDLLLLVSAWGTSDPDLDLDGDGFIGIGDSLILFAAWGACDCGDPTDSDGDGTPDCLDGCPDDPDQTEPGFCGCGFPDTDTDGDGALDCVDGCPNDPAKTAPGVCGCGVPDADADGDGTPDCNDGCPDDPAKTAPGACGCGNRDLDSDGDGLADCIDPCPDDPCGCEECPDGNWTDFIASPDTVVIYVSSSLGSDGNDGLDPSSPVRTLSHAKGLLRDGYPDWLLLRRGDAWSETFGTWTRSGRSAAEPMVIWTWGEPSAPRPRLNGSGNAITMSTSTPPRFVAFADLHLSASDSGLDASNARIEDILIEGCLIEGGEKGINLQTSQFEDRTRRVTIRRNVIVDNSQLGIYANEDEDLVVIDNVLDDNGTSDTHEHNMYLGRGVRCIVRGNISTRASNLGLKFRGSHTDGVIQGNVFSRNRNAVAIHTKYEGEVNVNVQFVGNLLVEMGYGMQMMGVQISGTQQMVVAENLFLNTTGGQYWNGPALALGFAQNYDGAGNWPPIDDVEIRNNTFFGWENLFLQTDSGLPYDNVVVRRNIIQKQEYQQFGKQLIRHRSDLVPAWIDYEQNVYHSENPDFEWFRNGDAELSFSGWVAANGETGAVDQPVTFVEPDHVLADYHATIGGTATFEGFMAEARKQERTYWRAAYTAEAIIAHFRAVVTPTNLPDPPGGGHYGAVPH